MNVSKEGFNSAQAMIERTGMSLRDLELMASNDTTAFKGLTSSLGLTQKELKNSINTVKSFEKYASTAGYSVEEFAKVYEKDAVGAMALFVDGLNNVERNGKNAVEILNEMGLTEVRLSNTILALAGSDIKLSDSIGMANNAWEENTALMEEVNKRYETTESKTAMLKNSFTALGITLFKSVKEPFIEVASSITDEIKKMSDELTGDSSLRKKLEESGRTFGKIFVEIAKGIRQVLPHLLDFIAQVIKLIGKVLPSAVKILTFFLKVGLQVATALEKVDEALLPLIAGVLAFKTAVTLARRVFMLFNIAMSATPIGLIAAALALLVTGIITYTKKSKEAVTYNKKLSDSIDKQTEFINEQVDSMKELKKARDESIESTLLEEEELRSLAEELKLITDENGKVKSGYEKRAEYIVNELKTALGIEIDLTNGVISNYQEMQKEIDKTIEKKKALAIVEAQEQGYTEGQKFLSDPKNINEFNKAKENRDTALKDLQKIDTARAELEYYLNKGSITGAEWNILNKKYDIRRGHYDDLKQRYEKAQQQLSEDDDDETYTALENYNKANKTYEDINKVVNDSIANVSMYQSNLRKISEGKFDEIAYENFAFLIKNSKDVDEAIKTANKNLAEYQGALPTVLEKYKTSVGEDKEVLKKVILDYIKQLGSTRDALKEQYDNATTYQDKKALAEAIRGIDEQIKAYSDGSDELGEILKEKTNNFLKSINKSFKINIPLTNDQYRILWEKLKVETNKGTEVTQELVDKWSKEISKGFTPEQVQKVQGSAEGLFNAVLGEMVIGTDLTEAQYKKLMENINLAIVEGTPLTEENMKLLVEKSIAQVNDEEKRKEMAAASAGLVDVGASTINNNKTLPSAAQTLYNKVIKFLGAGNEENGGGSRGGQSAANNILRGLINGLSTLTPSPLVKTLLNGAFTLGQKIITKINEATKSNSPSKEGIKAMDNVMSGLIVGLDKDEDKVLGKVKSFGETLTGTLQDSLGQVKANVAGSVNLDGQVNSGGFASNSSGVSNSKVINWTQNYTTPRPMSRYDMYIENKRVKNQILQEMNATT